MKPLVLLLLAAGPSAVLLPDASPVVQAAFERMRPLRYESIQLAQDHVVGRLCPPEGSCFTLRLDAAAAACPGRQAGPYCFTFPDSTPPEPVVETIHQALRADAGRTLWQTLPEERAPEPEPVAPPPPPPREALERSTGLRDWATIPYLVGEALIVALVWWSRRRAREVALAAAVALAAGLWLDHVNPPAAAGDDQAAGLVLAQDCVKLSVCHLESLDSGVQGFTNGAVWLHLLALIGLLGGTTVAVRLAVIAMMAVGVGVVFLLTRCWVRPAFAPAAAVLALYGLARGHELSASSLVDASAVFLPATLGAGALLIFVRTQRPAALLLAAPLLSLAATTHVAAASLAPALVLTAAFAGRRPILAAVLSTALYLLTALVTSRYAVFDSWAHADPQLVRLALIGWAVVVGLGVWAHRRVMQLPGAVRMALLGLALVGPHVAGMVWLQLQHRPPTDRYLPPIIAPAAMLAAALLVAVLERLTAVTRVPWLGRWLPVVAGLVALGRAPQPVVMGPWSFEDGRLVAEHLARKGWCYAEQFGRIQGPQCTDYAYAAMPYACHSETPGDFRRQMRLWLTRRDQVPEGAEALPTRGDHAVVLSEVSSWVDKQKAELCFLADGQRTCPPLEPPDAPPFLYSRRRELGFGNSMHVAPYTMSFTFPVLPVAGETHQFHFVDNPKAFGAEPGRDEATARPECEWRITEAAGLEADRPLPANPVKLTSKDGQPGHIVVQRIVGGPDCGSGFPGRQIPCHLETTASDPEWMRGNQAPPPPELKEPAARTPPAR